MHRSRFHVHKCHTCHTVLSKERKSQGKNYLTSFFPNVFSSMFERRRIKNSIYNFRFPNKVIFCRTKWLPQFIQIKFYCLVFGEGSLDWFLHFNNVPTNSLTLWNSIVFRNSNLLSRCLAIQFIQNIFENSIELNSFWTLSWCGYSHSMISLQRTKSTVGKVNNCISITKFGPWKWMQLNEWNLLMR